MIVSLTIALSLASTARDFTTLVRTQPQARSGKDIFAIAHSTKAISAYQLEWMAKSGLSVANLEVYFSDNTALHFTDQGVTDEDATICDSCDTKQFLSGGIVSDQIFVCAKCRVADE